MTSVWWKPTFKMKIAWSERNIYGKNRGFSHISFLSKSIWRKYDRKKIRKFQTSIFHNCSQVINTTFFQSEYCFYLRLIYQYRAWLTFSYCAFMQGEHLNLKTERKVPPRRYFCGQIIIKERYQGFQLSIRSKLLREDIKDSSSASKRNC